jgi:hypothetical protein
LGAAGKPAASFFEDWVMGKLAKRLFLTSLVVTASPPSIAFADMAMTIAPDFAMAAMMRQVRDTNGTSISTNRTSQSNGSVVQSLTALQLSYKLSSARTRANLAKFVEKTRATDPIGAAKMAQLFASTDIIGLIDQKMQQTYGMRANNVADAYAVWWTSAWMGTKGRTDDPSAGQMAMVKQQAANALAATPEFATASDAGKQELSEALLVQAALIQSTVETYQSDAAMLSQTKAAIAKGARAMGLDLSTMTLTDEGFVPSGKTGAADPDLGPAPGAPEQALATNENNAPDTGNPPYILMAAAGGAGIGGALLLGKAMGRRG